MKERWTKQDRVGNTNIVEVHTDKLVFKSIRVDKSLAPSPDRVDPNTERLNRNFLIQQGYTKEEF